MPYFFIRPLLLIVLFFSPLLLGKEDVICGKEQIPSLKLAQDIFKQITPDFYISLAIGSVKWQPPHWIGNTFQSSLGFSIDRSCFLGKTPNEIKREEFLFEETLHQMVAGVNRCARRRLMSNLTSLFFKALEQKTPVTCNHESCSSENAYACKNSNNSLSFKKYPTKYNGIGEEGDARFRSDVWFHEVLHLGMADNQSTKEHNDPEHFEQCDEIYFWQKTCFNPFKVLISTRIEYQMCPPAKRDTSECQLESCQAPFSKHSAEGQRFRYNQEEKDRSCLFYKNYLKKENNFKNHLEYHLVPTVLTCEKKLLSGGHECPDFQKLKARSPKLAALLPPLPSSPLDKISAENIALWARQSCAFYDSSYGAFDNMMECSRRIQDRFFKEDNKTKWGPIIQELLQGQIINEIEAENLLDYWSNINTKASFVAQGPGKFQQFVVFNSHKERVTHLEESLKKCQSSPLQGSEICFKYQNNILKKEAELLNEWGE